MGGNRGIHGQEPCAHYQPGEKEDNIQKILIIINNAPFFSSLEVGEYITDAGFSNVSYKQTLIPGEVQGMVQDGFGKGAFVTARGMKNA